MERYLALGPQHPKKKPKTENPLEFIEARAPKGKAAVAQDAAPPPAKEEDAVGGPEAAIEVEEPAAAGGGDAAPEAMDIDEGEMV